jgi:methylenetetrahydrofolate reductase (NADPH)
MGLGLVKSDELKNPLPWFTPRRGIEEVRPIYWANRPRTYIARTEEWDAFPNGRWGDSRSPAFSTLDDYHHSTLYSNSAALRLQEWGTPLTLDDIITVFLSYLDGKISRLPWNDTKLAQESKQIFTQIHNLNKHGFLTINSQPAVNCAPSDHADYGWGPKSGFVWQKAYIEFFCSPENLEILKKNFLSYPSLSYQAVNKKGEHFQNVNTVSAVTWGAFPNSEIKQPTIVDPDIFLRFWKDEAFALWFSQWGSLYDEGSISRQVIDNIMENYFLVNIVDNDFTKLGNIFSVFGLNFKEESK